MYIVWWAHTRSQQVFCKLSADWHGKYHAHQQRFWIYAAAICDCWPVFEVRYVEVWQCAVLQAIRMQKLGMKSTSPDLRTCSGISCQNQTSQQKTASLATSAVLQQPQLGKCTFYLSMRKDQQVLGPQSGWLHQHEHTTVNTTLSRGKTAIGHNHVLPWQTIAKADIYWNWFWCSPGMLIAC